MPDNPFLQPIRIPLRPSASLLSVFILLHAGAVAALFYTALPVWLQGLLIGVVLVNLGYWLLTQVCPNEHQPRELLLDQDGNWRITDGRGKVFTATLCRDALIHPALIALHLRSEAGRFRVLLTRANADADSLRRLRVRLGIGTGVGM